MGGTIRALPTDVAISEGLSDDQSGLIERRIRDGCEEHDRCEDKGKLFHGSGFQIELVVSVLTKRCVEGSRRMRLTRMSSR